MYNIIQVYYNQCSVCYAHVHVSIIQLENHYIKVPLGGVALKSRFSFFTAEFNSPSHKIAGNTVFSAK